MKVVRILLVLMLIFQCCAAQHWDSLYGGLNRNVTKLYVDSLTDELYVGGTFTRVNHQPVRGIATWSNDQWDVLGDGIDSCSICPSFPGSTWSITRYGAHIYIGGNFRAAGDVFTPAFARWDGNNWDSVPGGSITLGSVVRHLGVFNNELYICGTFDSVGNTPANQVARWDGTTWSCVGNNYNFNGILTSSIMYNGNLYVAGVFDDPLGNICRLAKWNGTTWQYFTSELQGGLSGVWDLETYNGELYVGGLFYTSTGCPATSIMRWNDTTWRDVGGSIEVMSNQFPTVKDMCVYDGKLYCVGSFEKIGGISAHYLASWDGTNWCGYSTIGGGLVENIAFYRDTMYVGGSFLQLDGDSACYIAQWIGPGADTCGNTTSIVEALNTRPQVLVYPSPASEMVMFQFSGLSESRTLSIYDQLGREIWRETTNENVFSLSVEKFAEGIYFYSVIDEDGKSAAGRFIVAK